MGIYTFTSESVCSGHPDKICDQISDRIVDAVLAKDPLGRVAVETLVTRNKIVLAGEVSSHTIPDYEKIVRATIKGLGYIDPFLQFTYLSPLEIYIQKQSPEIAIGVEEKGAGDQGMMFGFACKDTKEYMPLPIILSHRFAQRIDKIRKDNTLSYLRPDGKTQVTISYKNNIPVKVNSVIVAVPHKETVLLDTVKNDIYTLVVKPVLAEYGFFISPNNLVVNGTGLWHIGGPSSDTGVTGRKIVVDTYGGFARVGGGAFSGKDPTKVDRSGAYAARFIAKNIVAEGLSEKAEVRLAYFIGAKKPIMQDVETFGTSKTTNKIIRSYMAKIIDTSVSGIIEKLHLREPIYAETATYGHFGRNQFPWEKIAL